VKLGLKGERGVKSAIALFWVVLALCASPSCASLPARNQLPCNDDWFASYRINLYMDVDTFIDKTNHLKDRKNKPFF
jgi:hypothetical protein